MSVRDVPTFEGRPLPYPDEPVFDQGLAFDLDTMFTRGRLLRVAGAAGLSLGILGLAGCGDSSTDTTGATTTTTTTTTAGGDCEQIPEETAGPYPADGSNGPDVLSQSGVVRGDIRSSFGDYSGAAEGVPLTIKIPLQDVANGCAPLSAAAVYLWHCDRDGNYSLYTVSDQNYLRGVQESGADGVVTFTSIFPGCYSGRWPHIHFEVYSSLSVATGGGTSIATSQIALPEDACAAVYAVAGYEQSAGNLQQTSLQSDNVFGDDGGAQQLGTVTGSVDDGFVVELAVPVGA